MSKGITKIKLIIADDHPIFRSGINTALKGLPFISKIAQASNGEEVIRLLTGEHYDVVLMDIKMEPMDGVETTKVIRSRFKGTKVVALSMHNDEEHILDIFEAGASGYLVKNADKEEIETAIKEVMNGEMYFSKEVSRTLYDHIYRLKQPPSIETDFDASQKERIREVIFLICHEFTSLEIAEILFLSIRTIEKYRREIQQVANHKNLIGLIKFAMDNKILEDEELKKKFAKALAGKKN